MKSNLIFIFLFLFLFSLNFVSLASAVDISSCPLTLSAGTSYRLTADVSSSGTCFTIGGNSVTLDCDGHTITYDTGATGYGIYAPARQYLTVKNCNIIEYTSQSSGYGIYLTSSSHYFNITNTTVTTKGTSAYGFYATGGNHGIIDMSNFSTVAPPSVFLSNTNNNTIFRSNLSSTRRMCLWTYGTLTTYYDHNVSESNCEDKPILYVYNNNTQMTNWDASSFGQVLWTASNNWKCQNCTFNESGLFFGYMTNTIINASTLNCTDATALNMYGINTNNKIYNSQINVRGSAVGSYGIYLYNGANSNEFENVTIGITSPTSYGIYMNSVTANNFDNVTMTSNQATTYATYFSNSNSNDFDRFNFTTTGTSYGIYSTGTSSTNTFENFVFDLKGTSSSNRAVYFYSGANPFTFTNGTISITAGSGRAFYFRTGTSGVVETYNVTFDDSKLQWESGSTLELRKRWYERFNVTDSDNAPIESANVKLYTALGGLESSDTTDSNGLTAWLTATQYRRNYTTTTPYTSHSLLITKSGYNAHYNASANYNESSLVHVTLTDYAQDYPLPVFEDPTPSNNEIISANWFVVNTSVRDYAWENFSSYDILDYSGDGGGSATQIQDLDTGAGWYDNENSNPFLSINLTTVSTPVQTIWFYVIPQTEICGMHVYGSYNNLDWTDVGEVEVSDWGGGSGAGWYPFNATHVAEGYGRFSQYKIEPLSRVGANCFPNVMMAGAVYEMKFETLTASGDVANCTIFTEGGGIGYEIGHNMTFEEVSADFGYCWINLTGILDDSVSYYVVANDTESNEGTSPTRVAVIDTAGAVLTFVDPTPANATHLYGQDFVDVKIWADESLSDALIQWEKVGETIDNFTMTGSGEDWEINMTLLEDGTYIYTVFGNNTEGLPSHSETRWVYISTTNLAPVLTYTYPTPADKSLLSKYTFIVNITPSETLSTAYLEFNGEVNFSMEELDGYWSYNLSDLNDGTYTYKVYGESSASSIIGSTDERKVYIGEQNFSIYGYLLFFLLIIFIILAILTFTTKSLWVALAGGFFCFVFLLLAIQVIFNMPQIAILQQLRSTLGVFYTILLWAFLLFILGLGIYAFIYALQWERIAKKQKLSKWGLLMDDE